MIQKCVCYFFLGLCVFLFMESSCLGCSKLESGRLTGYQNSRDTGTATPSGGSNHFILWIELKISYRRKRPYRNPLRQWKKQLRRLKKQNNRFLKKQRDNRKSLRNDPIGSEPENLDESVHSVEDMPVVKKLGRPATIKTNHILCPTENCRGFRVLGPHKDHRIVGRGTYPTKNGERRQLYYCQLCDTTFSETRGTVFFGLKTPSETVYRAIACLPKVPA